MGMVGGGWEERGGGSGEDGRSGGGREAFGSSRRTGSPPKSSPAQRAPWCRPHGVVVSTPGEAVGAWHAEPKTPGQSHHCRHPAPLLRAWPAPSSREAAL